MESISKADALDGVLGVAFDYFWRFYADHFVKGWHDINRMNILFANTRICHPQFLINAGPAHHKGSGRTAFIARPTFPVFEGSIKSPCPTGRVVIVGFFCP